MKVASVADVKAKLSAYLDASAKGPVVVTRNGKAVAVLLGVSDDDELERLILAHSPKLNAILDAAERRVKKGAGIGHEDFWKRVESSKRPRRRNGNGKEGKSVRKKS